MKFIAGLLCGCILFAFAPAIAKEAGDHPGSGRRECFVTTIES